MRFLWCAPSLLFLLADVNCGLVEELFFSFSDPVGDQDVVHDLPIVAIDVVRLDFSFSDTTGDYSICVSSDAARPFVGSCRINVLLFNPDAGTSLDPGFLESHKDVVLDSPSITVRWAGTSPKLVSWRREDRVGLGTVAFGNPSDAPFSLFGSGVLQSVNDRFVEWKSVDYVGQDGGNNGQSTAIAPIVSNPFVLDSVDAPLTAQPNETQRTRPRPHTAPRPAHAPLAADQSHRVERPHMPVGAPRVASRARPLSDMMEDALAIGLPIAAAPPSHIGLWPNFGLCLAVRTWLQRDSIRFTAFVRHGGLGGERCWHCLCRDRFAERRTNARHLALHCRSCGQYRCAASGLYASSRQSHTLDRPIGTQITGTPFVHPFVGVDIDARDRGNSCLAVDQRAKDE